MGGEYDYGACRTFGGSAAAGSPVGNPTHECYAADPSGDTRSSYDPATQGVVLGVMELGHGGSRPPPFVLGVLGEHATQATLTEPPDQDATHYG